MPWRAPLSWRGSSPARWGGTPRCDIDTVHKEPEFSELFMSYLLTRNSRIEEDLIDQLFNSSEKRLARLLLLLANFGKEGRPEPIVGKFSQETLAEMIGTTRSRVSNFMNKFRDLGFISYNGSIEVHSSLLDVLLHDKPQIKTREAIDADALLSENAAVMMSPTARKSPMSAPSRALQKGPGEVVPPRSGPTQRGGKRRTR